MTRRFDVRLLPQPGLGNSTSTGLTIAHDLPMREAVEMLGAVIYELGYEVELVDSGQEA